jgi:IclR family transcriptional regulator, acetate operon repressor
VELSGGFVTVAVHENVDRIDETRSATDRSFAIIDLVLNSETALQARAIGAALDLPKATVHRLLGSLEAKGMLMRLPAGSYAPGAGLMDMAFKVLRRSPHSMARGAALADLARQVGETCNLGMLDRGEARYIERVEASTSPLRLDLRPGSRAPLHCSALGKVFLAQTPARQLEAYLCAAPFKSYTRNTLTTEAELLEALSEVRRNGYSTDDEEFIAGVACIATAVETTRSRGLVAVAVQAPKSRKTVAELLEFLPHLQRAAQVIGRLFDEEAPDSEACC